MIDIAGAKAALKAHINPQQIADELVEGIAPDGHRWPSHGLLEGSFFNARLLGAGGLVIKPDGGQLKARCFRVFVAVLQTDARALGVDPLFKAGNTRG